MSVLELGEKLEREDSLNILKHAVEIREEEAKKEAMEDSVEEPLDEPVGHPIEELRQSLLAHQLPSPSGLLPPRPSEYMLQNLPSPFVIQCLNLGAPLYARGQFIRQAWQDCRYGAHQNLGGRARKNSHGGTR